VSGAVDTILFYTPGSCSLSCMIALEWLGDPYRLCRIEKDVRAGEVYRRINPRGQVPALRVDGRTLVEANAILAHIADRHPPSNLLPENGTWDRDVANQWLAYLGSGFHPTFWPYFSPHRYVKDEAMHEAVRQAAVEAIARELRRVDAHLEGRRFIQGDAPSVLDAYLHSMDRWANKLVAMPKDYPNIWRHQKMMAKDPAVHLGLAIERGETPPSSMAQSTIDGRFAGHVELADLV
jgi:glutathione S-transferase